MKMELFEQVTKQVAIAVENALAYNEIATLKDQLEKEKLYLEEEIRTEYNFEEIINSSVLKRALQDVPTVATTDSTVLIYGETGTGKELIARAIHNLSERRERTLVKITAPQFRRDSWRVSYSVTKKVRLRAPSIDALAGSNWRTRERSFSTRLRIFHLSYSQNSCVYFRNRN